MAQVEGYRKPGQAPKGPTSVYPTEFFNIPHPDVPFANIQFRKDIITNETLGIKDPDIWEEITLDPNNFFNSITIEDNGGIQKVNLSLFDKNFSRLEKAVVNALVVTRLSNILIKDENVQVDDKKYFEFAVDRASMVNLRVRIGYSEVAPVDYIDDPDLQGDAYMSRTEKPETIVIRTPWIYLQILRADFNLTPEGLQIEMTGISSTGTFLDRAKLMQKFVKIRGKPIGILRALGKVVDAASGGQLIFDLAEPPDAYGDKEIEIMMGGEPRHKRLEDGSLQIIIDYKSVRRIIDDVCTKCAPRMYDEFDKKIELSGEKDEDATDENSRKAKKIVKYGYVIDEEEEGSKKVNIIKFYYQDANEQWKSQKKIRTYAWIEHGQTIIKNLSIETKTDFAQLNLPIAVIGEDGTYLYNLQGGKSETDYAVGSTRNIIGTTDKNDFESIFIRESKYLPDYEMGESDPPSSQRLDGAHYIRQLQYNINNQVFNGTLELPGDPFFLFDSNLRPFAYLIRIIVNRPSYYDLVSETGDVETYGVRGGEQSYLSGLYVIKKIIHTLNTSGYTTSLAVMKFPSLAEKTEP